MPNGGPGRAAARTARGWGYARRRLGAACAPSLTGASPRVPRPRRSGAPGANRRSARAPSPRRRQRPTRHPSSSGAGSPGGARRGSSRPARPRWTPGSARRGPSTGRGSRAGSSCRPSVFSRKFSRSGCASHSAKPDGSSPNRVANSTRSRSARFVPCMLRPSVLAMGGGRDKKGAGIPPGALPRDHAKITLNRVPGQALIVTRDKFPSIPRPGSTPMGEIVAAPWTTASLSHTVMLGPRNESGGVPGIPLDGGRGMRGSHMDGRNEFGHDALGGRRAASFDTPRTGSGATRDEEKRNPHPE